MKSSAAFVSLCLVAACTCSDKRLGSAVFPQPPPPAKMAPAQAAELASHLRVGMPEADAKMYLVQHGLNLHGSPGDSFHWADVFGLTNRFALVLDVDAVQPSDWGHGVLQGANIQRNGIILHSIALGNAA